VAVLQRNRLRRYGQVLRLDDSEWVEKDMDFVVEGAKPRGRPKRTWEEVVERDMKSLKIIKEDALICSKWRRLMRDTETERDSDDSGGIVCSTVLWYRLTQIVPERRPLLLLLLLLLFITVVIIVVIIAIINAWR